MSLSRALCTPPPGRHLEACTSPNLTRGGTPAVNVGRQWLSQAYRQGVCMRVRVCSVVYSIRSLTTNGPSPLPATCHGCRVRCRGTSCRSHTRRYVLPCRPPPRSTGEPRDSEACVVCTHSYAPHTSTTPATCRLKSPQRRHCPCVPSAVHLCLCHAQAPTQIVPAIVMASTQARGRQPLLASERIAYIHLLTCQDAG